ncbi:MAG: class II glutamine amidotransferase [candidate division WOR-3 bacterium]
MPVFLAAAGKFTMEWLLSILNNPETAGVEGGWGVAYCYGNRLETIRSHHSRKEGEEFNQMKEIRTDMAMLYFHNTDEKLTPRTVQPFVRREAGEAWAFCHIGHIEHPERLNLGGRYPDGPAPSETFFMHILNQFRAEAPVESVYALFSTTPDEGTLSFSLMSPNFVVAASWFNEKEKKPIRLWFGKGKLVRLLATYPFENLAGVVWEVLANRSVLIINRERRAV